MGLVAPLGGRRPRRSNRDLADARARARIRRSCARGGERRAARRAAAAPARGGVRAVSPNGVLGDPAGASARRAARCSRPRWPTSAPSLEPCRPPRSKPLHAAHLPAQPPPSRHERAPPARPRAPSSAVVTRPRSTTSSRTRLARQRSRLPSGPRARGVALVTGAARGIGAATVRSSPPTGWNVVAVDRAADDPRLPYAMGTVAELQALANERVVRAPRRRLRRRGARRGGRDRRAALGRARRDRRRGGRDRRRRARVGARRRAGAGGARGQPRRRADRGARRHPRAAAPPGAARGALHRRRLDRRDPRAADARRLLRVQGGRDRADPRAGGRARRHRHHRQRRQPRLDPHRRSSTRARASTASSPPRPSPPSSRSAGCSSRRRSPR